MSPSPDHPPESMPFPPGAVIAGGKYKVSRLLGEGGMGWVVVATHLQLEQRVALKFMRSTKNPEAVTRFIREARAAARIQSEHVARVSDVGTLENGSPYLVMEYLEGEDLSQLIDAKGAIPDYLAIDYAMQACEGLAEAHAAGIIHRDLKPANLFLARRTDGSVRVKLLDFGISKLTPAPGSQPEIHMTNTQTLMGSPLYMAPEQMRSSRSVDRRADIWSMGTIIYEMLAGRSPFEGETLPEVCAAILADTPPSLLTFQPDLSPGLEAVVMRCLEKDPTRRFPDVASLAAALGEFGTDEIRSTAQRIGRVSRVAHVPRESSPDVVVAAGDRDSFVSGAKTNPLGEPSSAKGAHSAMAKSEDGEEAATAIIGVGVQTSASFTRGAVSRPRPSMRPLAIGGGAVAIGVAVLIGVLAMGSKPGPAAGVSSASPHAATADLSATTAAAQPGAGTTAGAPAWTAAPTVTPFVTPPPAATPAATLAATAAAQAAPTVHVTPAAAPAAHAPAAAGATPTPVAAKPATAKPAATSSFGGRD